MKGDEKMKVELHCHSTASDGSLSPLELIEQAKLKGIKILALTDHDTTGGIYQAKKAVRELDITIIPGIELSTRFNKENIHILGYFKDNSYNSQEFQRFLKDLQEFRIHRGRKIIEKLKEHFNITLDYEKIRFKVPGVLGRPHIAKALIEDKYAESYDEVFSKFIGKDSPAYVPNKYVSLEDGVAILKKFNALVILAHPILITKNNYKEIALKGFDGIEAYYSSHSLAATKDYSLFAEEHKLLICGGSDFHGLKDSNHGYLGEISPPEAAIQRFMEALKN